MTVLIVGVVIWVAVHLIPTLGQKSKQELIDRLGDKGYQAFFTLMILAAVGFIIAGWRSTPEEFLYVAPAWVRTLSFVLVVIAFLLIGAAHHPTMIKRFIRHPMLVGVALWAISHLLVNGTTRALVLFGGLGLWALIEIPLINRRDGAYEIPDAPAFSQEMKGVFISAIIFIAMFFLHPYFAGVSPYPR